ncbi:hypothetical protein ATY41_03770 [Leifsonia xyli subsp. xyli]|uniref:Uncharacterized protein n=2 Tax=Leifsonia xyli subsp. xyli TaxID=59736 RepID=Q6AGZ8_LEIXX|nr:hypothetical protein [Leifsonia xyli]AAT88347.1 hypothetical protein Lxx03300 [Leifsonia xyli subsp. xyli str. CTCB07]ODA89782.1 hypothetical protein ATY41_03770 [Leifsonia xyli subsp. xyli]
MTRTRTATLALAVSLGACTMTPPPPPQPGARRTGLQLRDQLLEHIHDSLQASGLPDGWRYNPEPDGKPWDPTTSEFLGESCYVGSGDSQRLSVGLFHDPVGAAADFATTMSDY